MNSDDYFNSRLFVSVGPILCCSLDTAYEKSGSTETSVAPYEESLDILKHAYTKLPEVEDARHRLNLLKKKAYPDPFPNARHAFTTRTIPPRTSFGLWRKKG